MKIIICPDCGKKRNADCKHECCTKKQNASPASDCYRKIIKRDRAWHLYPIDTKAVAPNGGHYIRVKGGWKWQHGDLFPTPAADVNRVILPDNTKDEQP